MQVYRRQHLGRRNNHPQTPEGDWHIYIVGQRSIGLSILTAEPPPCSLSSIRFLSLRPANNAQERINYRTRTVPFDLVMSHIFSDDPSEIPESGEFIGASGAKGSGEGAS